MLAVVLASDGGSPAGASGTFCSKFVKKVSQFDGSPVAVTQNHGVIFYRDKKSKSAFYVCAPKSKSSSQSEDVDGATSFQGREVRGRAEWPVRARVRLDEGPSRFLGAGGRAADGLGVPPRAQQQVGQQPHGQPRRSDPGKVAFSTNCFSAWAAGATGGYTISVADTANRTLLENPNYNVGGVRVTRPPTPRTGRLKALGKDVVLHYTDDGQPLTKTFTYKTG